MSCREIPHLGQCGSDGLCIHCGGGSGDRGGCSNTGEFIRNDSGVFLILYLLPFERQGKKEGRWVGASKEFLIIHS